MDQAEEIRAALREAHELLMSIRVEREQFRKEVENYLKQVKRASSSLGDKVDKRITKIIEVRFKEIEDTLGQSIRRHLYKSGREIMTEIRNQSQNPHDAFFRKL